MDKILYDVQTNKVVQILQSYEKYTEVDGFQVEPTAVVGKNNVAYYNPDTGKIEWRQEDRPLTQEEKMDINTKSIQDLNIAMSEMIAG